MNAFCGNDEEEILRILGINEVPEDLTKEYRKVLKMYHRSGASGGLGSIQVAMFLYHNGYEYEEAPLQKELVDWAHVSKGTEVIVEQGNMRVLGRYERKARAGVIEVTLCTREDGWVDTFPVSCVVLNTPDTDLSGVVCNAEDNEKAAREKLLSDTGGLVLGEPFKSAYKDFRYLELGDVLTLRVKDGEKTEIGCTLKENKPERTVVEVDGVERVVPREYLRPIPATYKAVNQRKDDETR